MNTQKALMSQPPTAWIVGQVVVFDWCDGPRQGIARMAEPKCEFAFELVSERDNPEDLDDRLYRVSDLPEGSVTEILDATRALESPVNVVWTPGWRFESDEERLQADQVIAGVLSQQKDTGLVIHSRDMVTFLGCWPADAGTDQKQDWFALLGIP
jgi:hypothetical protein